MTDTAHASAHPEPSYRLRALGTFALFGPDGSTALGKHGHHHRRIALLAALAAAGDRGWSRDQLVVFFWPEATQTRARHSLEQLLYALRSSIGESLFVGTNPVRLNTDLVTSDLAAFTTAIERGDLETAVQEYRGPFLQGFYLSDAPEFERWLETERARLAATYASALQQLARRAESTRDHAAAARWWRRLTELDPVSSTNATGLIRSLTNAGDHTAALQYAEQFESVVAHELGTSVGPAVAGLVAEVRAETQTERLSAGKTTAPAPLKLSNATLPAHVDSPREVRPPIATTRRVRGQVGFALAAIVLMAAIAVLLRTMSRDRVPPRNEASIAVLPFVNVSRNAEDAPLVDGLTDDIIATLSKIGRLQVAARTSAFAFRDRNLDIRVIGESLHVANILEGSFQRTGEQLRVRVRLVQLPNASSPWSATYDRKWKDIFAIQSEIADSVARALDVQLGPALASRLRRGPTQNVAAYELYLRGKDPVRLRSDSAAAEGLALLQQAVALDSNFAAAYANMPYMYVALHTAAATLAEARNIKQLALAAARKALALDSTLPETHTGMGVALAIPPVDVAGGEAEFRRSIALGGSPRVHEHLARTLMSSGRYADGLAEAQRAEAGDPLSAPAVADVGEALCINGRYTEGLAHLARVAALRPPLRRVGGYLAECYLLEGHWDEAVSVLVARDTVRKGSGSSREGNPRFFTDPWSPLLGYALARAGRVAEAKRLQAQAIAHWRETGRGALNVAFVAAGLGDTDQWFEWLFRSDEDASTASLILGPLFATLRDDPRFERYLERHDIQKR